MLPLGLAAPQILPFVIVGGVIAVLVLVFAAIAALERRRLRRLRETADRLGLSFEEKADVVLTLPFASFPLFTVGHDRRATGLLSGLMSRTDRQMHIFDYRYTTGSGKNRSTHRQTVAAMRLGRNDLPQFAMRPEHFFDRIAATFGYEDIDIDLAPEFSRRWHLKGADPTAIRRCFDTRLVNALEHEAPICIEGGGEWLIVYRARQRVAPEALAEFIEKARELAMLFARR